MARTSEPTPRQRLFTELEKLLRHAKEATEAETFDLNEVMALARRTVKVLETYSIRLELLRAIHTFLRDPRLVQFGQTVDGQEHDEFRALLTRITENVAQRSSNVSQHIPGSNLRLAQVPLEEIVQQTA